MFSYTYHQEDFREMTKVEAIELVNCGPQPRTCGKCGGTVKGGYETFSYGPAHVQVWVENGPMGMLGNELPQNFLGGTRCKDEYQEHYGTTVVFFCREHFLEG